MGVTGFTGQALQEVRGQERDVLFTFAQGGDPEVDDTETVVEVFAEAALFHHGGKIAVGSSKDADVDRDAMGGADWPDLFFLQGAQQFGLQVERQLADLVEKDGSSLGGCEQTFFGAIGAGERPFHIAEEFAFHKVGTSDPQSMGTNGRSAWGPLE